MKRQYRYVVSLGLVLALNPFSVSVAQDLALPAVDAASTPELEGGFQSPPMSARPRVWWHWMNGNVTIDGIDKDIDWLSQIGIGGLQNFDANLTTPQIVPNRLVYMTPEWKAAFRHAVERADAKGLEFAIAASPGWSETGGPWVIPADGMKKVTWSEAIVPGGTRFRGKIAPSPGETGPYQTLEVGDLFADPALPRRAPPHATGNIAVLAIPVSGEDMFRPREVHANERVIASAAALTDADLRTTVEVASGTATAPANITQSFDKPVTVRAARIFIKNAQPPFAPPRYRAQLEALVGGSWQQIAPVPLGNAATTVSFAPVTASQFRLVVGPGQTLTGGGLGSVPGAVIVELFPAKASTTLDVGQFQLFSGGRIDQSERKAGFGTVPNYYDIDGKAGATGPAPEKVIDITSKLRSDGTLDWLPPAGTNWRILRFGWSLTGTTNHPATPEATGLEVDKFDSGAVERYLNGYLAMYRDAVGANNIGAKGVRALLTDSIEVGPSNWTSRLREEFKARRGYDPLPWLPALAGIVVGSVPRSDAFLYDYRRTLGELMAEAHYGTVARVAHDNGLKVYGEALEDGRPVLGDDLDMRRFADVPMAALWTYPRGGAPRPGLLGDMKGASSVAHFYGQNLVAAESMTSAFSPWAFAPSDLKRIVDLEFAQGVNRPVIHTSVHQPTDDKLPGLSLAIFGQYFNRHETWAAMAKPWVDYMARSSFLLQQGRNIADIAIFYGEETPVATLYGRGAPEWLPRHNAFDFVNATMLGKLVVGADGNLSSPGGAQYRVLYLAGTSERLTVAALRELKRLADLGARIVGKRPVASPSLADSPREFDELVSSIWSRPNVSNDHDIDRAMDGLGLTRDYAFVEGDSTADLRIVHRRTPGADIYFVNNRENRPVKTTIRFRVSGKAPELWQAIDGTRRPLGYEIKGDVTSVPLELGPEDAAFVVFKDTAAAPSRQVLPVVVSEVAKISGPWRVSFASGAETPMPMTMTELRPLNELSIPAVQYFSGTASYEVSLERPKGIAPDQRLWLDLGKVGDLAEVLVNGKSAGIAWFAPYRLEIGSLIKPGINKVEVRVANLWVNRLIGDKQPGVTPSTWTAVPTYKADAPLRASGLIGPVTLLREDPGREGANHN